MRSGSRNTFLAFVRKEFYHISRDTRTMMILLLMPLIQIILFGFAITTEVKNSKIAIYDPSVDIATRQITERLNASEYFNITQYISNPAEISKVFQEGKAHLIVVFGERFNETLLHTGKAQIQLIADATDPNNAASLTHYASAIIGDYQQTLLAQNSIPYQITPEIKLL